MSRCSRKPSYPGIAGIFDMQLDGKYGFDFVDYLVGGHGTRRVVHKRVDAVSHKSLVTR